jgi:protein ImuB
MVRPPRKIQVALEGDRPARLGGDGPRGRVRRLAGPWRVSGGWWEEPFARDYFDVELGEGRVYRIFRESECWYLSGACG